MALLVIKIGPVLMCSNLGIDSWSWTKSEINWSAEYEVKIDKTTDGPVYEGIVCTQ